MLSPPVERSLQAELAFHMVRAEAIEPWQAHNNHFAVYSFELGATGPGSSLTTSAVVHIAEFAAQLHAIGPHTPGAEHVRTSVPATFSFADRVRGTRARLAQFTAHASLDDPSLAHTDWQTEIEALIGEALRGAEDTRIPSTDWRFSTADLAPHNILVTEDDHICVLDLEYSGWDDPLMPATDFLTAETSTSLRRDSAEVFLRAYAEAVRLTPLEVARLSRTRALMEIGWIAVHLCLLAPERIAPKRFADPAHFDEAAHVAKHTALAEARLARAKALLPTLL